METEGIFRISPSRLTLDEVIVLLDQGSSFLFILLNHFLTIYFICFINFLLLLLK